MRQVQAITENAIGKKNKCVAATSTLNMKEKQLLTGAQDCQEQIIKLPPAVVERSTKTGTSQSHKHTNKRYKISRKLT